MKPSKFQYHVPATVGEAVGLLAEHADEAKVLAGGQSLVPMMSLQLASFGHLVDLNRALAGLDTIERTNGHVRMGALGRQASVAPGRMRLPRIEPISVPSTSNAQFNAPPPGRAATA